MHVKNAKRRSLSIITGLIVLVVLLITSPFVFGSDFLLQGNTAQAYDFRADLGKMAEKVGLSDGNEPLSLPIIIGNIIYSALGLIGVISLLIVVLAGIRWMTAGGNEEKVAKSRKTLTGAAIGALIALGAYAITYFVINIVINF